RRLTPAAPAPGGDHGGRVERDRLRRGEGPVPAHGQAVAGLVRGALRRAARGLRGPAARPSVVGRAAGGARLALGLARAVRRALAVVGDVEARALERDADGLDDALHRVAGAGVDGQRVLGDALLVLEDLVRDEVAVDVDRHPTSSSRWGGGGGAVAPPQ